MIHLARQPRSFTVSSLTTSATIVLRGRALGASLKPSRRARPRWQKPSMSCEMLASLLQKSGAGGRGGCIDCQTIVSGRVDTLTKKKCPDVRTGCPRGWTLVSGRADRTRPITRPMNQRKIRPSAPANDPTQYRTKCWRKSIVRIRDTLQRSRRLSQYDAPCNRAK